MLSLEIIDSDAFLEMPTSARELYFHFSLRADDDGFIDNAKRIMKLIGAADDDLKILVAKRYVLLFESGIIVIKHWKLHNYIRSDRYNETRYLEEKALLKEKKDGAYTLNDTAEYDPVTGQVHQSHTIGMPTRIPIGCVGKERLGKVRLGKVKGEEKTTAIAVPPSQVFQSFLNDPESMIRTLINKGFDENITRTEIKKFIAYWTEPTRSGDKQRWQTEKTFELTRRLITWFNNIQKYNRDGNTPKLIRL